MNALNNFSKLINLQTVLVTALAMAATYACLEWNYIINLPSGLIGIAVVFPIVFSVNAAYRRREEALRYFASIKAHLVALHFTHRDWVPADSTPHVERFDDISFRLLQTIREYLTEEEEDESLFQEVYNTFTELSHSMETLRQANVSGSEISRSNQYLRGMMIDFERMRNIYLYRTPTALRAYSQIFLTAFPILFAPYFAYLSQEFERSAGFVVAAMYGLILVSLENIQEDLENPYDGIGEDDLNLDVASMYRRVLLESGEGRE